MPSKKKKSDLEYLHIENAFDKLLKQIGNQVEFELPEWVNKWKPAPYTFIKRSILFISVHFSNFVVKYIDLIYHHDMCFFDDLLVECIFGFLHFIFSLEYDLVTFFTISLLIFTSSDIYMTKKIKRRLQDDGIFCSCCPSAGSSGVCGRDCHCGMLLSSCSSGCKCGPSCLNKPFQHRPVKKMKLIQTEKCGAGIVADEDIERGEFVIEYVGEVIDDNTCEERLWNMKHRGEKNFYLCEINRDMVIDATYKGNKSRYINHSCCPNTEMQKWIIDGETRIGIFATRDIRKGEHLTYDYQFVQFGADQDCHCGATGCRRKLGVKPSKPKLSSDAALKLVACQVAVASPKSKAILSEKDVHQNGGFQVGSSQHVCTNGQKYSRNCIGEVIKIFGAQNERSFGMIKWFDKHTRKHAIMFEDGAVEFLDMSKEKWDFVA